MGDYLEDLEKNGHELTLVSGPLAGISMYYCERCGGLARTSGSRGFVNIFHTPPGSPSTWGKCVELPHSWEGLEPHLRKVKEQTLKEKLDIERDHDNSRLRSV